MTFAKRRLLNSLIVAALGFLPSCREAASEDSIRSYIANHPDEIIESVMRYRDQGVRRMERQQSERIKLAASQFSEQGGAVFNPSGRIEIIEIVDYNCAFCKASFARVEKNLSGKWRDVRVKVFALPVLGSNSESADILTRFANTKSGRSDSITRELLISKGVVGDKRTKEVAHKFGIDIDAAKNDEDWRKASQLLKADWSVFQRLSTKATPAFIIDGVVLIGFNESELDRAVATERGKLR